MNTLFNPVTLFQFQHFTLDMTKAFLEHYSSYWETTASSFQRENIWGVELTYGEWMRDPKKKNEKEWKTRNLLGEYFPCH